MKVLVLNCGSSSIKYQVYDVVLKKVIEKGSLSRIGENDSLLKRSLNGTEISQICQV